MNGEIRKLTYAARPSTRRPSEDLPPALQGAESVRAQGMVDLRLEARVHELEREREESGRIHQEALSAQREALIAEREAALEAQRQELLQAATEPLRRAVEAFEQRQQRFFREAEGAVVRLTLGIARKILHREAQVDPLMLRTAVRVALEQVQAGATCILEVPEADAPAWSGWVAAGSAPVAVRVQREPDLPRGHCRLEIGESRADLSVDTQLTEIERGFMDLLERRGEASRVDLR